MTRFCLGEVRLSVLSAGTLWLDGGAMFGIVPRVLWERERPADDRHRIRMAMNLLLIEDGGRRILVDTGAGTKLDGRAREIYGLSAPPLDTVLAPAGLRPDQIDVVVNTHLHFDHAGGNTLRTADGALEAAFPNATYVVQRAELEIAQGGANERVRASFPGENFAPLLDEPDRLQVVVGEAAVSEHVRVRPAPGHTPGMQLVLVESGGKTVAFMADLLPTASHAPYTWIMAFDLEPLTTLATRHQVYPEAIAGEWVLVLEHDHEMPLAVLEERNGRPRVRPWAPEE